MSSVPPGVNINTTPAAKSPTGVYDFNSPENNATVYIATSVTFAAITFLFVLLKLYVRLFVHKKPGWDDLCTVVAYILQTAQVGYLAYMFGNGGARHQWDMSLATYMWVLAIQRHAAAIQMPTYLMTKLALFILFYRIFSMKKWFKWAIYFGVAVVASAYLTVMFIFIFGKDQHLLVSTQYGIACINLISDVYLLLLPLGAINSLQLPTSRKIGVAAVFALGLLACTMSAIALKYRFELAAGQVQVDGTYTVPPRAVVLNVEMYVGIMCGCFPVLPAMLRKTTLTKFFANTFASLRSRLMSSPDRSGSSSKAHSSGWDEDAYPLSSRDKPVSLRSNPQEIHEV